jgi:PAS domain S-box-containing protein
VTVFSRDAQGSEHKTFQWTTVIPLLAVCVILVVGGLFHLEQERAERRRVEVELKTVARLKATQIEMWRTDRASDGDRVRFSPGVRLFVGRWLEDPSIEHTEDLRLLLASLRYGDRYRDVLLVDAGGKVLLRTVGSDEPTHSLALDSLDRAMRERTTILSDFHVQDESAAGGHIDIITPVFRDSEMDGEPIAAIVLHAAARDLLYPLISSWPTARESAETVLVGRDGNEALVLNDVRYAPDSALTLRIDLSRTDVPAVRAVLGEEGFFEGADYRGEPVVAFVMPIEDSPWRIVAKIDSAEVFRAGRVRRNMIGALLLVLTTAAVSTGVHSGVQTRRGGANARIEVARSAMLRSRTGVQRHVSASETPVVNSRGEWSGSLFVLADHTEARSTTAVLERSEQRHRRLFEHMRAGFALHKLTLDADGRGSDYRFEQVNPAFERLIGLSAHQLIGRTVREVLPEADPVWIERFGTTVPQQDEAGSSAVERHSDVVVYSPDRGRVATIISDIAEGGVSASLSRHREFLESQLRILQHEGRSERAVLDAALEESLSLTRSAVGCIHLYDQTTQVLTLSSCSKARTPWAPLDGEKDTPLEDAGVWGESVRRGSPFVMNRSEIGHVSLPAGLQTDTRLERFMSVPIQRAGRIVAVVGLANSPVDYNQAGHALTLNSLFNRVLSELERVRLEAIVHDIASQPYARTDADSAGYIYQVDSGADGQERRFIYVSRGVESIHGLTDKEVMGDASAIYGQLSDEDRRSIAIQEYAAFAARRTCSFEARFKRPDGEHRWVRVTSHPQTMPDGRIVWEGMSLDVTKQKTAEEELERRRDRLGELTDTRAMLIRTLEAELNHTNLALSEIRKDAMRAVQLPSDSLVESVDPTTPRDHRVGEESRSATGAGDRGKYRLAGVGDILDLVRVEQRAVNVRLELCDLGDLVSQVVDAVAPAASAQTIEIGYRTTADKKVITTDRELLSRVVLEVGGRAVMFARTGSVDFELIGSEGRFTLIVTGPEGWLTEPQPVIPRGPLSPVSSADGNKRLPDPNSRMAIARSYARLLGGDIITTTGDDGVVRLRVELVDQA